MGKSYCPGWSQTVDEGNFCAKTPAYLCGNQPVSQVLAISAPRPSERPKLGHDLREIHSTDWSEQHLTQTSRDPELKHKLNFDVHTPAYALCSIATVLRTTCFTGPCSFSSSWTMSSSSRVAAMGFKMKRPPPDSLTMLMRTGTCERRGDGVSPETASESPSLMKTSRINEVRVVSDAVYSTWTLSIPNF